MAFAKDNVGVAVTSGTTNGSGYVRLFIYEEAETIANIKLAGYFVTCVDTANANYIESEDVPRVNDPILVIGSDGVSLGTITSTVGTFVGT